MKDSLERRLEVSRSLGWPVLCVSMWLCVCVCVCVAVCTTMLNQFSVMWGTEGCNGERGEVL